MSITTLYIIYLYKYITLWRMSLIPRNDTTLEPREARNSRAKVGRWAAAQLARLLAS